MFNRFILSVVVMLLMQSCTTNVRVEGTVPTPLVNKIPAKVGVYYSDEYRQFHHKESIEGSGDWDIDLGTQNLTFFRNVVNALFLSVTEVGEPPLSREEMSDLDGIIVPSIEKYGFLTPHVSGLKFYSVSIEYRIVMYDKAGGQIGDWRIIGYGKSEGGRFSAVNAMNKATVLAIRDGGARLAIDLIDLHWVRDWLKTLRGEEPARGAQGAKVTPVADAGSMEEEV